MADNAEEVADKITEDPDDSPDAAAVNPEEVPNEPTGDNEEVTSETAAEAPVEKSETEDVKPDEEDITETTEETSPEKTEEATEEKSETPEDISEEKSEATEEIPSENKESNSDQSPENVEETPEVTENVEKTPDKPKPVIDVDMSQEITVYHSSISCSQEVKKRQQTVEFILTSKKYNVKFIDLASIGESAKEEMRKIADDPKCLPPQIAKGEEYCGNYVGFMEAVEDGQLLQFLKLTA